MSYALFLDDDPIRIPNRLSWIDLPLHDWIIVRNYKDFVKIITDKGLPFVCSFDHDIADQHYKLCNNNDDRSNIDYSKLTEKTGRDCAVWLVNYCIDKELPLPEYYVHSLNPCGADNIRSVMESGRKIISQPPLERLENL